MELKARTARSIADEEEMLELGADCPIEPTQVYIKSEADKVISDLEESHKMEVEQLLMEIVKLKKACKDKDDWCLHTLKRERRRKYKQCVAMAKWCERKRIDAADYRIPREKWIFYDKWHTRWLELAEVFKEAK